jgi:2',3'-cyclic-nucleotide 2'-phosphodiesterase (5'-nucleotidase family)
MNVLQTLEANVNQWADAISERTQRAEYLRGECDRLVSESIDLTESKAKQARKDRAEYLSEFELIEAQLQELARRREVAAQAVKEYLFSQAQEAYTEADRQAREKRQALNAALDARLHFVNHGGRKAESEASINTRKDIEISIATAQAELTIANRKAQETGAALQALTE